MSPRRGLMQWLQVVVVAALMLSFLAPAGTAFATERRWEIPQIWWGSIRRWKGRSRYGTSEFVAIETFNRGYHNTAVVESHIDPAENAIVVTGENFPDALAAALRAGSLMCRSTSLMGCRCPHLSRTGA